MNICVVAHIPIYSPACKAQVVKPWDMPATMTHPMSQLLLKTHNTPGTAPLQVMAVTGFHGDLADTTSQHTSEIRTSVNIDTW